MVCDCSRKFNKEKMNVHILYHNLYTYICKIVVLNSTFVTSDKVQTLWYNNFDAKNSTLL